jgi:hypothetical protein
MRVNMSQARALFIGLLVLAGCARPEPLTEEMARQIVFSAIFMKEPVYAEVPQRVTYGPRSPKDDYDEKAVRTLRNLEKAGLLTIKHTREPDGTEIFQGTVTKQGFTILGTMPSARGPAFRARIGEKVIDEMRNFIRHPSDPTVASAEVVWHYDSPTPYYDMFETKIDKPLRTPFVSLASFYWDKGWKFNLTVRKTKPMA